MNVEEIKNPYVSIEFDRIGSTHEYVSKTFRQLIQENQISPERPLRVSAVLQTAGIGQRVQKTKALAGTVTPGDNERHSWTHCSGNIAVTHLFLLPARLNEQDRRLLPFVAGAAVIQFLNKCGFEYRDLQLKWVNDILLRGRKVAGILCASEAPLQIGTLNGHSYPSQEGSDGPGLIPTLISVGINVLFHPEANLSVPATSIRECLPLESTVPEHCALLDLLSKCLWFYVNLFVEKGFSRIHSFLDDKLYGRGQTVTVLGMRDAVPGHARPVLRPADKDALQKGEPETTTDEVAVQGLFDDIDDKTGAMILKGPIQMESSGTDIDLLQIEHGRLLML